MAWINVILERMRSREAPNAGAERAEKDIRGRFNPIRQLEPANLSRWIDEFEAGNLRSLARLLDALSERDETWKASQRKTIRSVSRCPWSVAKKDGHEKDPEAQAHYDALVDFYSTLRATALLKSTHVGGVAQLIRQMMLAERDYYSTHELVWRVENGKLRLRAVHVPLWMFEARTGALRFLPTEFAQEGSALLPGEWLAHCGDGVGIACSICATYKRLSMADWLAYGEHNATPGLHTKTPAKIGTPEWKKAVEATRAFAKEWAIVTGSDVDISKIDMSASGALPYETFIQMMNRGMTALWRGGDLSTVSADNQGASLQGEEMDMLEQGATEDIAETLRAQVDPFVIEYYFGQGVQPLAEFTLTPVNRPNVEQEIQINEHLARAGAKIPVADELSRFGRRAVDPNDPDDLPMEATPDPAAAPGTFALGNEAPPVAGEDLAAAIAQDLKPVSDRLDELLKDEKGDLKAAAARLLKELPELAKKALADPAAAILIEKAMRQAAGMGEGSVSLENEFDPSQPRDENGQWSEVDSPGSAPEGDDGRPKKRTAYGSDLVEWNEEEQVARRYEVDDVKETLSRWKPKKLKEERSFKGNSAMASNFDKLHVSTGGHIRTGTKIKWKIPAETSRRGNGMPVVG